MSKALLEELDSPESSEQQVPQVQSEQQVELVSRAPLVFKVQTGCKACQATPAQQDQLETLATPVHRDSRDRKDFLDR